MATACREGTEGGDRGGRTSPAATFPPLVCVPATRRAARRKKTNPAGGGRVRAHLLKEHEFGDESPLVFEK